MNLEIERKFRLKDAGQLRARLASSGVDLSAPTRQVDQYFAHPLRDFAATDEALRVRFSAGRCAVTYKGPKVDRQTKSRNEIELAFDSSVRDPQQVAELLQQLGFRSVATVIKRRQTGSTCREGQQITVDLDDVDGLGTFVELEIVCDPQQSVAAKSAVAQLAAELQLQDDVRASYLELLLQGRR